MGKKWNRTIRSTSRPILVGLFYRQNNCQGFQVNDQIIYEGKLIRLTLEFSGAAYNLWPQGSYIFKKSKKRSATQKFYTQPNFASISNYRKTVSNIRTQGMLYTRAIPKESTRAMFLNLYSSLLSLRKIFRYSYTHISPS